MSPITGKLRLAFSAIRDILRNNKSGYSAVWSSAFDWGSKGREFKSLYPDHFFRFHPLRLLIEAVFILTQIPLNTKVLQIPLSNVIPPENFTFSPFLTPSGTIVGQFSEGERSAAFGLSELSVNIRHKSLTNNFPDKMSRSSSYSHYLLQRMSNPLSF